jgi:hypothetical protein
MPIFYNTVRKQNVTDLLYTASLINNTDLQESIALSNLVLGIAEQAYNSLVNIQNAVTDGPITLDTYILAVGDDFAPRDRFVATAGNILELYA